MAAGIPQSSVLGLLLWNIMYGRMLGLQMSKKATVIGFADDLSVVVLAKHAEEVKVLEGEIRVYNPQVILESDIRYQPLITVVVKFIVLYVVPDWTKTLDNTLNSAYPPIALNLCNT